MDDTSTPSAPEMSRQRDQRIVDALSDLLVVQVTGDPVTIARPVSNFPLVLNGGIEREMARIQ